MQQAQQPAAAAAPFASRGRAGTGSMKWTRYPEGTLPMWVADMDFPAAGPILEALRARVEHGVFGYTLPDQKLLEACMAYFERRWSWRTKAESFVFSPGLGAGIHTATRYLGEPASAVIVPEPVYPPFRKATVRAERPRRDLRMRLRDDGIWELDLDELNDAAAANPGGVFMLSNPHNPNGKVYEQAELERIAEICLAHGVTVCADEVHADLILDEGLRHVPFASLGPEAARICVTLQSPSKAYNVAGLNFAALVIDDPELRARYERGAYGQVVAQLNPLGMAAATAAWSGACDEWLRDCVAHLRGSRDLLHARLNAIAGVAMPPLPATYLAWVRVAELSLANPFEHFLAHGLALSDGRDFGDPEHLRWNFGCGRDQLEEGLRRFEKAAEAARG
ncbi:MAG: aminotransferase class I/II-fold pyridoxal phosphate-dependent enzyme [Betaproteobacteria bacterium AqS2]|uniref:cysteine-S-conjugate beta-lyase n=1 Tax=Candidatus Amphirhobacter heronislandensis TaxID=1732024 RepID=A0A930UGR9_9GAMM|nr:aminotransferase class I/II-fold pyridoxal phosphate-dependent enzyme [Betaproteobacteria bacterium AqS2]